MAAPPSVPVAPPEPAPAPPTPAPAPEKVPLLKREISFKRKPKKQPVPSAEAAPAPEKVPLLKREIHLGGKGKKAKAAAAQPATEKAVTEKVPLLKREIHLGGKGKKAKAAAAQAATEKAVAEKVPLLKREIGFKRKPKAAPEMPAPAAATPAVETAPQPDVAAPAEALAAAPVAPLPPAPVAPPEPAPAPVAPPAPAPAPAQEKVPLLKREIHLGGKGKKAKAAAAQAATEKAVAEKVPLLKREISFKRKPKSATVAAVTAPVAAAAPVAPPAEKVPLLKRDVSFRRKAGAPSAPASARRSSRSKSVVGVKVGASGISAAHVVNDGQIELMQLVREPLARGVVVGGELREPDALAAALRAVFQKYKLPRRAVRLGVSNNRIGVRIIELAGVMEPKQLQNAIRFRAQEVLPITLEDAVLDYQQLSESVNAEGELVRRILLVVAYRDLIDRYVEAFKKAGVRLVGIDLEAFGLLRALTAPMPPGQRAEAAHVVVSIGHERSTFAVSDGSVCEFTRVLDWGGATLDVAIARQLSLTPSEAEPVKHALALDGSQRPLPPGLTEEQLSLAADLVRRQLQTFARELVSSLQFYQNQAGSLGIGDIVISGGTSQLPGLATELQRLIGVSVRLGDPFQRLNVSKRISEPERLQSLAIAIGLGIED